MCYIKITKWNHSYFAILRLNELLRRAYMYLHKVKSIDER